jgi:hypothetical protein
MRALLLLLRPIIVSRRTSETAFSPMNLAQKLFLSASEKLVGEFPTIWHNLPEPLLAGCK